MLVRNPVLAIIYDLDGTLIDSHSSIEEALNHAVATVLPGEYPPSFRPLIGPPVREILRMAIPKCSKASLLAMEQVYRQTYDNECCVKCECFPGVIETLTVIQSRGIRQFIATNKPSNPSRRILEATGLHQLVEVCVSPDSCSPHFSSKEHAVAWILSTSSLLGENCFFVGDSIEDCLSAKKNGIRFMGVSYGYGSRQLPDGEKRLQKISDLITAVS
jgi:phosphoglycolate phosphatase